MSAALTITPASNIVTFPALPEAPEHDPAFARLSKWAKDKFVVKLSAMEAMDHAGNKTAMAVALAKQMVSAGRGFSRSSLLRDYYLWLGRGRDWRALMDAAMGPEFRASKRSGGVLSPKLGDGCALPPETADWWAKLAESFQRNSAPAWREAQRLWEKSWHDETIRIPGYGSAREYWARREPSMLAQRTCPTKFPRGWTHSTFYTKMPRKWESANARVGKAYARGLLPGVPLTRRGARYLEWVFFDDKWHDFSVVVDGVLTPCRLLELGALDYATGEYICWGFRPELPATDDEGRLRLKEQDMKWLVGALLQQEGFPRDYDCHLICERGTAVLREGAAQTLSDYSGGRIKTQYTEMMGGHRLGWKEKNKGNSKGKAPIESTHSLHKNEASALPGQSGVDHERQPATHDAQLREARDLLALGALMTPEEARLIRHSLLTYEEAVQRLGAIYRRANERTEHNLEGFEPEIIGWRLADGQPWTWGRELPEGAQGIAGLQTTRRKASPLERKAQLKAGQAFEQLPDWAWPLFYEHAQKVRRIEKLQFRFTLGKKEYQFFPPEGGLEAARQMEMKKEKLCGYFDERNPERLYLTRENGAFFATWQRVHRAPRGDREAVAALRKQITARAEFARRGPLRRMEAAEQSQIERGFANGALLQKAGLLPPPESAQTPGAELARVVNADRRQKRHEDARKARRNRARIIPTEDFSAAPEPAVIHHAAPATETPAAENGEGFQAGVVATQPNRPKRRRILAAEDFC